MAWSITALTANDDSTNQQSYDTASVSPTANRWLVVGVSIYDSSSPGTVSLSGLSLSWSEVVGVTADTEHRIAYHMANTGDSPGSGALTISITGSTNGACAWSVFEVLPDTAVPSAATVVASVIQSQSSSDDAGDGTETATLGSAITSGNRPFAAFGVRSSSATTLTPETNWTEIHERADFESSLQFFHTVWRDSDADNSYTGTADGSGWANDVAIIFELAGAATAPAAPTDAAGTASGDSITGTFTDNSSGTATHRAYYKRSTDSIWIQAADLDAGETSFVFEWLAQGTAYDIGFTSFDDDSESPMTTDTDITSEVVRLVSGSFL